MTDDHATVAIVKTLRYDLTAMQGKVSELLRQLGELDLEGPAPNMCAVPGCGYRSGMNLPSVAEHAREAHGESRV